jgi:hypothetical protein
MGLFAGGCDQRALPEPPEPSEPPALPPALLPEPPAAPPASLLPEPPEALGVVAVEVCGLFGAPALGPTGAPGEAGMPPEPALWSLVTPLGALGVGAVETAPWAKASAEIRPAARASARLVFFIMILRVPFDLQA